MPNELAGLKRPALYVEYRRPEVEQIGENRTLVRVGEGSGSGCARWHLYRSYRCFPRGCTLNRIQCIPETWV
jgi:hypothetical protein